MAITRRCIESLDKQDIYQWDEVYPARSDFQGDIQTESLYLITAANEIFGCICLNKFEHPGYENGNWHGSNFFVIHKMIVDPKREGQGSGEFAMMHAEKMARSKKKDSVRLDCFKENARANRFYQRLGYALRGEVLFRKGMFNLYEKMI